MASAGVVVLLGAIVARGCKPISFDSGNDAGSNDAATTSRSETPRSVPAMVNVPPAKATSSALASISSAAIRLPRSTIASAASVTPMLATVAGARAARAAAGTDDVAVALKHLHGIERYAEPVGGDLPRTSSRGPWPPGLPGERHRELSRRPEHERHAIVEVAVRAPGTARSRSRGASPASAPPCAAPRTPSDPPAPARRPCWPRTRRCRARSRCRSGRAWPRAAPRSGGEARPDRGRSRAAAASTRRSITWLYSGLPAPR